MAASIVDENIGESPSEDSSIPVLTDPPDDVCCPELSDELREYVVGFIEKEVGSDVKSLRNVDSLLEKLKEGNRILEEQVLTSPSSVPPKVSAALKAAEDAQCSMEELLQKEKRISAKLQQNLQDAQPWMEALTQKMSQVEIVEKHMKYLRCLQHIEELSAVVQQCLMTSSVWDAIRAVESMAKMDAGLSQSKCAHLRDFLRETLHFWHKIIKDRLTGDLEKVLTALHWPITSPPTQSLTPVANGQELASQLELLVTQLLALQTSDDLISQRTSPPSKEEKARDPPLCLPIQIMLVPLSKRFRYHFYGNRQTNTPSKPEWYLTQVLMWIGNSTPFMEEKIQPILDRANANINAKVELCRGLLTLVQEKVAGDASRLLYDDALFCHLVEEVLQFEKELRGNYSYPAPLPGLLHLLLDDAVLQKWLTVEKKTAVEKVDAMLSAEGAWSSQYKDIRDMDELKSPDCAETFMTLLQVITDRYRALPCSSAQLKFLELQKELVDDFRIRLTQVMKEESRCPLSPRYCAILNAVNYISTILTDWGDNVFFLQLQQAAVSLGDEAVVGNLGVMEMGRLASLESSLFEGLLALLDRLRNDMIGRLLDGIMRDITEKTKVYSQDRWFSHPSQHDMSTMSLSSSACPMMLCIRDCLLNLNQVLSLTLFQLAWQGLAERLDTFLYQEVILSNHFSDGGAAQLQFDMTRNLFPLFGHYCKRPENFFKHVKEACIILCLNVGSAILLKNLIKESGLPNGARDRSGSGDPSPQSALNELGVYYLASNDVLILLNLRASWPGQ
ncbi:RAD50-interacting protein 1 [Corythoichthys intestinalis]|uniref:RAD50-interacting protein 1 n=1 Tax=Corythoichthys intestinalis TaxID=161448 RepID=UPI0025A5FECA|nr:RAD50-interacting protein 1 [Corythoichthys intestinalis]XP_061809515.1 RAD50-interacting protein 1-like [Nerophis lumbriciformis]